MAWDLYVPINLLKMQKEEIGSIHREMNKASLCLVSSE